MGRGAEVGTRYGGRKSGRKSIGSIRPRRRATTPVVLPFSSPTGRALLFALVAATNVACVTKPTMHLNHAEISGVQMGVQPTMVMTVVVDVYNPNGYDVAVRAMRGQVWMADRYPVALDYRAPVDQPFWMPAGKTTSMRVPLYVPLSLAIQLVQEAFASPTIAYRVIARADVTGSRTFQVEKDDYAVDERGTMTREQMAAIIPNSIVPPPR